MVLKTTRFDPADYLRDEQDIADYLSDITADGDPGIVASALDDAARARNMGLRAKPQPHSRS